MNTSGRLLLALTTKQSPMSSINHGGGKRRSGMFGSGRPFHPHHTKSGGQGLRECLRPSRSAKRAARTGPPRCLRLPRYRVQSRLLCCRGGCEEVFASLVCIGRVSHTRSRSRDQEVCPKSRCRHPREDEGWRCSGFDVYSNGQVCLLLSRDRCCLPPKPFRSRAAL